MSASPVIPREKLSAYQRWELSSFNEPAARTQAQQPRSGPRPASPEVKATREGYDAGYREGMAAAQRDATREFAGQARRLADLLNAAQEEIARLDQELAEEVLQVALRVAKQIVHASLTVRPELVLPTVEEVLRDITQASQPARLMLHPDDARVVRAALIEQLDACRCAIAEDPELARGGCRLESASGEIDATLETRWQRVEVALGQATAPPRHSGD